MPSGSQNAQHAQQIKLYEADSHVVSPTRSQSAALRDHQASNELDHFLKFRH